MPRTNGSVGRRMSTEMYPNVRRALSAEYADLPNEDVEALIMRTFGPGVSAEMVEGFFDDLGRGIRNVARQAAPYVAPVLSGAASGAATGAALGPWGALAGGLLGGITSGIGAAQQPRGQPAGGAAARPGGQIPAGVTGAAGPTLGRASPAAGQLLSLLSRPEIIQALTAMFMGQAGRPATNVAGTPVPNSAITGLLGALAQQAESEFAELVPQSAAIPRYLLNAQGEALVDPAIPEARAARVLGLFHEAIAEDALRANHAASRRMIPYAVQAAPEANDEAYYDMLDLANLYANFDGEYAPEDDGWGG